MSDDAWPCWACSKPIEGTLYQAFSLTQKWKGDYGREGSYTRVSLCLDCGRCVLETLYAIQDEAAAAQDGERGNDERG